LSTACLEHGATTLLTEDRDFARFAGITPLSLAASAAA
jgi:predicted nucleic acid-binding protein